MNDGRCCLNCRYHEPIPDILPEDNPECPYIRCQRDKSVHPKWDDCEDWRDCDDTLDGRWD